MSTFKDRGIILKAEARGESDKILTLLTKERGRLAMSARGASKPRSKFAAAAQPFAYSDFVIFEGRGFLSLAQCDVIDNFYSIREDFDKYCRGAFFLEYMEKLMLPGVVDERPLYLLLCALKAMDRNIAPPRLAMLVFEMKLFQLEGLAPTPRQCSVCGDEVAGGCFFGGEGFVCRACRDPARPAAALSPTAAYAISYILETDIRRAFCFRLEDGALRQAENAVRLFRQANIDLPFKSLELIDSLS